MLQLVYGLALALAVLIPKVNGIGAEQGVDASQVHLLRDPIAETAHDPQWQTTGSSHNEERERLLQRIDRESGQWDDKHPRWKVLEALHGFDRYNDITGAEIGRFEGLYKHVPQKHKQILESTIHYGKNFEEARSLLEINAVVCKEIVENALAFYNISRSELSDFVDTKAGKADKGLRTSVSQALKHIVRDWSIEGHAERDATFPFILDALRTHLPVPNSTGAAQYKVHVPGAGLGRLAHEIASVGPHLTVTANEFSAYMNLAYRWAFTLQAPASKVIHPFVEAWSHARTRHELFRSVEVPDASAPTSSSLSNAPVLVEGDFTRVFANDNHIGQYDAVVTLFFIDTARNLVQYLETIYELLKPGGVWINVGPLLYGSAPWVQLSLDEVLAVSQSMGFSFDGYAREEKEVLYNFNQSSLYHNGYVAQYWIARKEKVAGQEGSRKGWFW